MKKSMILLFIIAILLFPFSVLAEGEEEPTGDSVPTTGELLKAKYKELLLYACSPQETTVSETTNSSGSSSGSTGSETAIYNMCNTITNEEFDWSTLITDDTLYVPIGESEKVPIVYTINEENKNIHFTVETNFHKGMTQDEVSEEIGKALYVMYSLPVVAMMNGATEEEGMSYLVKVLANMVLSSLSNGVSNGVVVLSDDPSITYEPEEGSDVLVIRESEFPDRVIEYIEKLYGESQIGSGLYFLYGTSMTKIDNDNAKVSTTYSVNYEMNLDVLKDYIAEPEPEEPVVNPTEEDEPIIDDDTSRNSIDPSETTGKDTGTIPNPETSTLIALIVLPILAIAGYVLYSIKYKKKISKV